MAEELYDVLARFHREVVRPEIEEITRAEVGALRGEMLDHLDAIYHQLEGMKTDYRVFVGQFGLLERQVNALARRADLNDEAIAATKQRVAEYERRMLRYEEMIELTERDRHYDALRAEMDELKSRVAEINAHIAELEARIPHSS